MPKGWFLTKRRFVCGPSARIRTKNEERQGRPRNNIKTRLLPHWLYFNSPKDTQKPQPEDRENFVLECGMDEVFCIIFVNNELDSFKIGNKRRRFVGTLFEYSEKFIINPRASKFAFFTLIIQFLSSSEIERIILVPNKKLSNTKCFIDTGTKVNSKLKVCGWLRW